MIQSKFEGFNNGRRGIFQNLQILLFSSNQTMYFQTTTFNCPQTQDETFCLSIFFHQKWQKKKKKKKFQDIKDFHFYLLSSVEIS